MEEEIKDKGDGTVEYEFKLTDDELINLNYRLDKLGFKDLQEMIDAFRKSDWPENS
ncbi:MAG: hypothetical protein L0H53_08335 [Candidatus Nitrosocosmicus sp.]|nr:hypothetical protein [Candidatus Nitrosocosmicus sp.]